MDRIQGVMPVALVRNRQYREHEKLRAQTNTAMMGLLAASKLAEQTLVLTDGSNRTLGDIFPKIEHIRRFNLKTDAAREVLANAQNLLGVLAVPQGLALHEDLLRGMLLMLVDSGRAGRRLATGATTANIHDRLQSATSADLSTDSMQLFQLIRVARNTHIHSGGRADTRLVKRRARTDAASLATWTEITGSKFPDYEVGEQVQMGIPELIGSLAVCKRLAEEANTALQQALPRTTWALIAVQDWRADARDGNPEQLFRRLRGFVRQHYGPLGLNDAELEAALFQRAPFVADQHIPPNRGRKGRRLCH